MNWAFGQATPEQGRFLQSDARLRAFLGGVGCGKTWAGAVAAWLLAARHPGATIAVCRADWKSLMETTWPVLRGFLPPAGGSEEVRPGRAVIRLKNNSEFVGIVAGRPEALLSWQFDAAWLDEPRDLEGPEPLEALYDRLHGPVGPHRAWVTGLCLPGDWVEAYFFRNRRPDEEVFTAGTETNPYLPPGYVDLVGRTYGPGAVEDPASRQGREEPP